MFSTTGPVRLPERPHAMRLAVKKKNKIKYANAHKSPSPFYAITSLLPSTLALLYVYNNNNNNDIIVENNNNLRDDDDDDYGVGSISLPPLVAPLFLVFFFF